MGSTCTKRDSLAFGQLAPGRLGGASVPEASIPATSIAAATTTTSTPTTSNATAGAASSAQIRNVQIRNVQIRNVQIRNVQIRNVQIRNIPLVNKTLSSTLLSAMPITYPAGCSGSACTGWAGVLAGTPYATDPLQSVSLADVLSNPTALARFNSVTLGDLNLSGTALGSLPLIAVELAGVDLTAISITGSTGTAKGNLKAWCNQLKTLGYTCVSQFKITPTQPSSDKNVDLLALSLAGVPVDSFQIRNVQIRNVDLATSQIRNVQIRNVELQNTQIRNVQIRNVQIRNVQIRNVQIRSVPATLRQTMFTCAHVTCGDTSTATLLDAQNNGAIKTGAVLADLENLKATELDKVKLSSLAAETPDPLNTILLSSIDLGTHNLIGQLKLVKLNIERSSLGAIPVNALTKSVQSTVVTCARVACTATSKATLATAAAVTPSAIKPTATLTKLKNLRPTKLTERLSTLLSTSASRCGQSRCAGSATRPRPSTAQRQTARRHPRQPWVPSRIRVTSCPQRHSATSAHISPRRSGHLATTEQPPRPHSERSSP